MTPAQLQEIEKRQLLIARFSGRFTAEDALAVIAALREAWIEIKYLKAKLAKADARVKELDGEKESG